MTMLSRPPASCRYCLCPHSACAAFAARPGGVAAGLPGDKVCVLTAHPAKFEETVAEAVGGPTPASHEDPRVAALKALPNHHFTPLRKAGHADWRAAWVRDREAVEAQSVARS